MIFQTLSAAVGALGIFAGADASGVTAELEKPCAGNAGEQLRNFLRRIRKRQKIREKSLARNARIKGPIKTSTRLPEVAYARAEKR